MVGKYFDFIYMAVAYSETCQISKIFLPKQLMHERGEIFSLETPSEMFNQALNTPLIELSIFR